VLVGVERAHRDVRQIDVEQRDIAGGGHVVVDDVGQPHQVVGKARSHAAAALWMPPVLHVAFDELPRRCAQNVLSSDVRIGVHERHHVLQLISEAVSSARLVERRPRPHAA
jgi:hypothetical protein